MKFNKFFILLVCLGTIPSSYVFGDGAETVSEVQQIVAHRGASSDRPENTLAAFRLAIKLKATAIEIDVRTSKDGELFLLHDTVSLGLKKDDIIRVGNILSRDYIVGEMTNYEMATQPQTLKIEQEYDLSGEPEFNVPTQGSFPFPNGCMKMHIGDPSLGTILPSPERLGFQYVLQPLGDGNSEEKESEKSVVALPAPPLKNALPRSLGIAAHRLRLSSWHGDRRCRQTGAALLPFWPNVIN